MFKALFRMFFILAAGVLPSVQADFVYQPAFAYPMPEFTLLKTAYRAPVADVHTVDGMNIYAFVNGNCVNLRDPMGLFSWKGFGQGVLDIATEPFKQAMDVGTMGAVAVYNATHDDEIHSEDVEFKSMAAKAQQQRVNEGQGFAETVTKGAAETAGNVVTGGGYGLVKNTYENVTAYERNEITYEQLDYNLSHGAGAQFGATALAAGVSKATGQGWTGAKSDTVNKHDIQPNAAAVAESEPEFIYRTISKYDPHAQRFQKVGNVGEINPRGGHNNLTLHVQDDKTDSIFTSWSKNQQANWETWADKGSMQLKVKVSGLENPALDVSKWSNFPKEEEVTVVGKVKNVERVR